MVGWVLNELIHLKCLEHSQAHNKGLIKYLLLLQIVWTDMCDKGLKSVVPNLFETRDPFHGRQFFHGPGEGGMVSGWFKYITFIVHFISIIITL